MLVWRFWLTLLLEAEETNCLFLKHIFFSTFSSLTCWQLKKKHFVCFRLWQPCRRHVFVCCCSSPWLAASPPSPDPPPECAGGAATTWSLRPQRIIKYLKLKLSSTWPSLKVPQHRRICSRTAYLFSCMLTPLFSVLLLCFKEINTGINLLSHMTFGFHAWIFEPISMIWATFL